MIPFYQCCDRRCQGLSNGAKSASLALWGGTGEILPPYGGSLLDTAARSGAPLASNTQEHLSAVLRSKMLQKSPRARSPPLSIQPTGTNSWQNSPRDGENGPPKRRGKAAVIGGETGSKNWLDTEMGLGRPGCSHTAPGKHPHTCTGTHFREKLLERLGLPSVCLTEYRISQEQLRHLPEPPAPATSPSSHPILLLLCT